MPNGDIKMEARAEIGAETGTEERTNLILETTPLAVTLFDKNMNAIDCNDRAVKLLGFTEKEEYLRKYHTLVCPTQPDGSNSAEFIANYFAKAVNEGYAFVPEIICRRLDGSLFPLESTYVRIHYKNDLAVIEYCQDITEKVAAREKAQMLETKLREQEIDKRIRLMFDVTPLMIEYWDMNFNALDCNQTTLDYYSIADKKTYLNDPFKYSPGFQPNGASSLDQWREHLKNVFEKGSGSFEFTLDVYGETAVLDVYCLRTMYNNEMVVITYSKDVSNLRELQEERQRIEIAEESNKAKSSFLARMSHEIRTPVTAIMGIAEIQLQNSNLPPQVEESFVKIYSSSNLLLGIINDILDHSKIESGKMTILQEEYELANMISDAAQLYFAYLEGKDIKFNMQIDDQMPAALIGDALRIEQIISNLLSNAFKYTESGTIELSMRCRSDETRDGYVFLIICISDSGLGMTAEQLKNLHKEYERFHEDEVRSVTGAGLGMPIVYNLLNLMDGQIKIESVVGKGTNINVEIPQKKSDKGVLGKETANILQQFRHHSHAAEKRFKFVPEPMPYGRVLVVDDVEANLYVAKGLLAFYDLNVETSDSGHAAVVRIKNGEVFDLIFMDHMMPGLNGLETMRLIRKMGYKHPIVALTANAMMGQAEMFIDNGFDGFISKPIETSHLNAVLTKHIRDKQPPGFITEALKAAKDKGSPEDYLASDGLKEKLKLDFIRNHSKSYKEIEQALILDDLKNARLLAHSLKSSAGLIAEKNLVQAAAAVELLLAENGKPGKALLNSLKNELEHTLDAIGKIVSVPLASNVDFDKGAAMQLFDELAPLLESNNADCFMLLDELRKIPETAVLAKQIDDIDFDGALKTLTILREILLPV